MMSRRMPRTGWMAHKHSLGAFGSIGVVHQQTSVNQREARRLRVAATVPMHQMDRHLLPALERLKQSSDLLAWQSTHVPPTVRPGRQPPIPSQKTPTASAEKGPAFHGETMLFTGGLHRSPYPCSARAEPRHFWATDDRARADAAHTILRLSVGGCAGRGWASHLGGAERNSKRVSQSLSVRTRRHSLVDGL